MQSFFLKSFYSEFMRIRNIEVRTKQEQNYKKQEYISLQHDIQHYNKDFKVPELLKIVEQIKIERNVL